MKIAQRNDAEEIEAANQYQHDAQASESSLSLAYSNSITMVNQTHSLARRAGIFRHLTR